MSWNNQDSGFGPSSSQMGGGFTSNASGFSQTPAKGGSKFANQTLHPCTIKQLLAIDAPADGGSVTLDGRELTQVKLCGNIRGVQAQSTFTSYEIDDGTGMMNVKNWATPEEAPALQENTYATICGRLSFYEGRCSVTAFSIRPVTDHNELTFHLLETCYAHKSNLSNKGPVASQQPNFGGQPQGGSQFGGGNQFGGGGFGGADNGGGFGGGGSFGDDSMTPLQGQILQIATQYNGGEEGIHIDQIIRSVGSGANVNDIREAVEWLTNEGQLYSTIDDEHFKSTSE